MRSDPRSFGIVRCQNARGSRVFGGGGEGGGETGTVLQRGDRMAKILSPTPHTTPNPHPPRRFVVVGGPPPPPQPHAPPPPTPPGRQRGEDDRTSGGRLGRDHRRSGTLKTRAGLKKCSFPRSV